MIKSVYVIIENEGSLADLLAKDLIKEPTLFGILGLGLLQTAPVTCKVTALLEARS